MPLPLIEAAIALAAASGLPGLLTARRTVRDERIAAAFMAAAGLVGLVGAGSALLADRFPVSAFPWPAAGGSFVGVDALSAFFLVPIFLVGGLGPVYGLAYWSQSRHRRNGRRLRLSWGLLVAGMALLVSSRHAMAFLLGWETMALAAFFLIATEDDRAECRRAGLVYLIATHVGTLTLFGLFALWRWATGSYDFVPVAAGVLSPNLVHGLMALALVGFGLKAGMMPLHFWLPEAHANAPSHVSAMLSGVVLKMGVYGLVRFVSLVGEVPSFWGAALMLLGAAGGLLGVVFALGQHDLKRLLAYHSVENIGIILMGLGLAMVGRSAGRPEWMVLGMAGCLLHTWNHGLFKSLLFLGAGSVLHGTRTRDIDRLGGLAHPMPWTAAMFLVGAVAICGLPPLNGFVSEFLLYVGLFGNATDGGVSVAVVAVPTLAMIGALAVACFVKVHGIVFLGNPRTRAAAGAHESPAVMLVPMGILAAGCVAIGLAPALTAPILDASIASWLPAGAGPLPALAGVAPLGAVGAASLALVALVAVLAFPLARRIRISPRSGTWDCGYAQPTARMQYTASSFAQTLVMMFAWMLRQKEYAPAADRLSPATSGLRTHIDDAVLDRMLLPAGRRLRRWFAWFHRFQQGRTQHYVLYILVTVILMLVTLLPVDRILTRIFTH